MSGYFVTAFLAFWVGVWWANDETFEQRHELSFYEAWKQDRASLGLAWWTAINCQRELRNANRGIQRLRRRKP